jgi:hypothetical protein
VQLCGVRKVSSRCQRRAHSRLSNVNLNGSGASLSLEGRSRRLRAQLRKAGPYQSITAGGATTEDDIFPRQTGATPFVASPQPPSYRRVAAEECGDVDAVVSRPSSVHTVNLSFADVVVKLSSRSHRLWKRFSWPFRTLRVCEASQPL